MFNDLVTEIEEQDKLIASLEEEVRILKNRIKRGVAISCDLERRYVKLEEELKIIKKENINQLIKRANGV